MILKIWENRIHNNLHIIITNMWRLRNKIIYRFCCIWLSEYEGRIVLHGEIFFFYESVCRKFTCCGKKKRTNTIRALKVDGVFSRGPSDPNIAIDIWNMTGWRDRLRRTRQARSCSKSALPARIPKHFIGICRAPREGVFDRMLARPRLRFSLCVP